MGCSIHTSRFLSTPSARRATQLLAVWRWCAAISIHALREEGDSTDAAPSAGKEHFYPRPPRGGRQHRRRTERGEGAFLSTPSARRATRRWYAIFHPLWTFLSTPSARRATVSVEEAGIDYSHFYPRPPRGGRRSHHRRPTPHREISIHALREEGDLCGPPAPSQSVVFLSTPSARRATFPCLTMFVYRCISIHALREEGDRITPRDSSRVRYFYPRPPRGGRHKVLDIIHKYIKISIHALREEGDRHAIGAGVLPHPISIHALREEGDVKRPKRFPVKSIFLSTPSARRATFG